MTNTQALLVSAGVVGMGAVGAVVYLTYSNSGHKPSKSMFAQLFDGLTGDVSNLEEGDNLKEQLNGLQEIEPSEARFFFSNASYDEKDNKTKIKEGEFAFSAIKREDDQSIKGVLIKTTLSNSNESKKKLTGVVVTLSQAKGAPIWTIEKGFGFSTESFNKELKVDSTSRTFGYLEWSKGTDGSFFNVLHASEENGYKPLFGSGIKDLTDVKITKVYVKGESKWKKVKDGKSDEIKNSLKDLIKSETKGTWKAPTAS